MNPWPKKKREEPPPKASRFMVGFGEIRTPRGTVVPLAGKGWDEAAVVGLLREIDLLPEGAVR